MAYHYSQQLTSIVIKGVYKIIMPDNAIGTFSWFVSDVVGRSKNKKWHKQLISNGYKYQLEQSN